jgi:ABC-2 type transport system ATP-binding protein/lipopolysaccharide transport system ATP-binding protein
MQDRLDEIVDFSGLGDRIRHPLYTYSSGMRARLAFSIATSVKPEILIIDEGIGAADEEFAERAAARLDAFLQNAGILVLASHSNQLIETWCEKKVRIESGQILSRKM